MTLKEVLKSLQKFYDDVVYYNQEAGKHKNRR